ncbi:MAG: hypothetical protein ACXVBW_14670, partial [Bdellovibrionota bacterium]
MIKVGLLTAWLAFLPSAQEALSPTNPSIAEARRTLNHLLEQSDADPRDLIALLRSYRGRSTAPALTIASGPYFGFILSSQINELYPLAYDAEWNKDVAHPDTEVVAQVSPVTIFDALMDLCLDGKAPPQFAPRCKQIGRPLMERIREAKEDQLCQLDASNQTDPKASGFGAKIKLLFMKIATWVGSEWPSSCDARKAVYAYAKHDILEARRTDRNVRDEILKEFPNLFPERFREGFLEQMAELRKALPALITAKFSDSKTKPDPLWSAPLVELEDERDHVTSVREVAEGLKADFGMAALLAHSKDMAERALAAPLFYAASNRLILVLGGLEARWNRGFERFDVLDRYDPAHYKAAPKFVTELFGGIGAELDHAGAAIFSPWDFSSYPFGGGKFRVFPSRFTLDLRHSLGGVPHPLAGEIPSESFADLAELL